MVKSPSLEVFTRPVGVVMRTGVRGGPSSVSSNQLDDLEGLFCPKLHSDSVMANESEKNGAAELTERCWGGVYQLHTKGKGRGSAMHRCSKDSVEEKAHPATTDPL